MMGYFRHHAIVVTGGGDVEVAHATAISTFADTAAKVTEVTPAAVNSYRSFLVAPDGDKDGWEASEAADQARDRYIEWLRSDEVFVSWVEVCFGGDEPDYVAVRTLNGFLDGDAEGSSR